MFDSTHTTSEARTYIPRDDSTKRLSTEKEGERAGRGGRGGGGGGKARCSRVVLSVAVVVRATPRAPQEAERKIVEATGKDVWAKRYENGANIV